MYHPPIPVTVRLRSLFGSRQLSCDLLWLENLDYISHLCVGDLLVAWSARAIAAFVL